MYDQLKVLIEKCTKLDYIKRLEMTVVRSELEKIQRSVYPSRKCNKIFIEFNILSQFFKKMSRQMLKILWKEIRNSFNHNR